MKQCKESFGKNKKEDRLNDRVCIGIQHDEAGPHHNCRNIFYGSSLSSVSFLPQQVMAAEAGNAEHRAVSMFYGLFEGLLYSQHNFSDRRDQ